MVEKLIVDEDSNATSSQQSFFKVGTKKVIVESDIINSGSAINNLQQSFMKILDKKVTLPGDGDGTRTLSSAGSNDYFYLAKDQQPTHYTSESTDTKEPEPEPPVEGSIVTHPTLSDNLVSYYKLDETSGTSISDSLNTNNATATNSAILGYTGIINKAVDFSTGNYYISAPMSGLSSSSGSISLWVKVETGGDATIGQSIGTNGKMAFYFNANGTVTYVYQTSYSSTKIFYSNQGTSGTENTWRHVVYTSDSSGNKLYINGSQVSITYINGTSSINYFFDNTTLYIGASYHNGSLDYKLGKFDEIALWSRALTSTEISDLYNEGNGLKYD